MQMLAKIMNWIMRLVGYGLGAALIGSAIGGEHVAGEALQLEPDIEADKAAGGDHHAHADRAEDD